MSKYEREVKDGKKYRLPDQIKIAIMMNETKGALREHLQLNSDKYDNYQKVKELAINYYKAKEAFKSENQKKESAETGARPRPHGRRQGRQGSRQS